MSEADGCIAELENCVADYKNAEINQSFSEEKKKKKKLSIADNWNKTLTL